MRNMSSGGILPSLFGTVSELMTNKEEPKRKNTLFPTIEDEDSEDSEDSEESEESEESEDSEEDDEDGELTSVWDHISNSKA